MPIKKATPKRDRLYFVECSDINEGLVETVCTPSLHFPYVIYLITVTRRTATPSAVETRTVYMPALN